MRRTGSVAVALVACTALISAQSNVPFGRIDRPKFRSYVSAVGQFEVDYPNSADWVVLPGPIGSVLTLAEHRRREALIVIERQPLRMALTSSELEIAVTREAAAAQAREPDAADLSHRVLQADQRYILIVEYTRPGIYGRERVIHYGLLIGDVMYRVICRATETTFSKYALIFGHVAASVRPAPIQPRHPAVH